MPSGIKSFPLAFPLGLVVGFPNFHTSLPLFHGSLKDTFCPFETWLFQHQTKGHHHLPGNVTQLPFLPPSHPFSWSLPFAFSLGLVAWVAEYVTQVFRFSRRERTSPRLPLAALRQLLAFEGRQLQLDVVALAAGSGSLAPAASALCFCVYYIYIYIYCISFWCFALNSFPSWGVRWFESEFVSLLAS